MKQFLLLCAYLIALTTTINMAAQVGIGTTDPKETLHIAGDDSTIRIDGFNSFNNSNNDGLSNISVSVDAEGNFVLEKPISDRFVDKEDIAPTIPNGYVGTQVSHGFESKRIYSYEVTTTDEAKYFSISYQIGLKLTQDKKPEDGLENDHEAKMYGFSIVVNETFNAYTQTELTTQAYATSSQAITNGDKLKMFNENVFVNGHAMVKLEPNKTYYFHLICFVNNSDSDKGVRAIYGGNGNMDRFQLFEMK